MSDLTFENVNDSMFIGLPEFRERYRKEMDWWQGAEPPGQYVVFGFVITPAVRELLSSDTDPAVLNRIFEFFEEMARSPDIQVTNLLQIGICEWLVGDPERFAVAWKYMGRETKNVARRTARIRRCEQNLPPGE